MAIKFKLKRLFRIYNVLRKAERRLDKETDSILRSILLRIAPDGEAVDISDLEADDYDFYGLGITLYNKHGFYENGIPTEIEADNQLIRITCNGCESDAPDEVYFHGFGSCTQYSFIKMMSRILSDIARGKLVAAREGSKIKVCYLKTLLEAE